MATKKVTEKKTTVAQTKVTLPVTIGQKMAFFYKGAIRSGTVEAITTKTILIKDFGQNNEYRSFLRSLINAD
jgi:hypothetical protein